MSTVFSYISKILDGKSKLLRFVLGLLSYLIPVVLGVLFYEFIIMFPVYNISVRILPDWGFRMICQFFVFSMGWIYLAFVPGPILRRKLRKMDKLINRTFSANNIIQKNLSFVFPILGLGIFLLVVKFIDKSLSGWNINELGYFLLILNSLYLFNLFFSIKAALYRTILPIIEQNNHEKIVHLKNRIKRSIIAKSIWFFLIFLFLYVGFDFIFEYWLGAWDMALWFKVAMFFLHGQ